MAVKKYYYEAEEEIPLYRGKLVVIATNDGNRLSRSLIDYDNRPLYAHTWFAQWKGDQGFIVIFNFSSINRDIYHGVVAHEAIHAVHMILQSRGVTPDFVNDESVAYLLEWVVDTIYKCLKEFGKEPKGNWKEEINN